SNITGTANIDLQDPTTLTANVTLNGANVTFESTVDDDGSSATGSQLTINGTGTTKFSGVVGGVHAIDSLNIAPTGNTVITTTSITTGGNTQTYNNPVTLTMDTSLSDTGSGLFFNNTVDSDADATPRSLTLTTSGSPAAVQFSGGAVGGGPKLHNLTISNTRTLTLAPPANPFLPGALLQNGAGSVSTAGSITTNSGTVTFSTAVTLTGAVALSTTGGATAGANINFNTTVDGGGGLTATSGTATVSFGAAVGSSTPLANLTV